uniref:Integrase, catalytic region, zinc finger, CCHC-type, peptidase aspartic, catalytic n=1 Tax=Tanacetum cinerariifolium TaxID=118510 RepID=A0A6L2JCS5_TANCI|nr:integrase, catalytic region, zinc finger, CCHC-type, peptidase aspartic, catalytic [Tanacetum cinerariifolium]
MHAANNIVEARCLELEARLSNFRDNSHHDNHEELVNHFSKLEVNHLNLQLKYQNLRDSFRNDPPTPDKNTPDFDSVFVIGKMQASLQGKDNVIRQLKKQISHLQETRSDTDRTLKHYKELYDYFKITRAKHIEQVTTLTTKNVNLKAQILDKVNSVSKDHVKPKILTPGKYAIEVEPIVPRLRNNKEAHLDYLRHLKESVETIRDIVEEAKVVRPLDKSIISTCRYTKHSQELLEYAIGTCPKDSYQRDKKHAPALLCVNRCTTASGSKHRSNTKKNMILSAKSVNKLHIEEQSRINKYLLRTSSHVDSSSRLKRTVINSNSDSLCQTCNKCLITSNHDMCEVDYLESVVAPPLFVIIIMLCKKSSKFGNQNKLDKYGNPQAKSLPPLKDETPEVVIKFLQQIQVEVNKIVQYIRTDNGIKFINQTLADYYERIGIFHQKKVPRTPQQNGVVEIRNRTLVEAARTMPIFSKALMFLWAEAVATACYTQNRSLIHIRHNKTPYELVHNKKPDLTFFRVFGAFCYPINDSKDLGKLQPTADIRIFDSIILLSSTI